MTKVGKCAYCRKTFSRRELTRDHVIAGSWYPTSTPTTVQRITVLSCRDCNTNRYSSDECYSLLRLAACVNPELPSSEGVWKRARQAMNVTRAPNEHERAHRQATWDAFNQDTAEIESFPTEGVLPSFASNVEMGSKTLIKIQAEKLDSVIEKWGLGIHSYIWKEVATIDAEVAVMHITPEDAQVVFCDLEMHWKTIDKGPGIQIGHLTIREENKRDSIYEFRIWGQLTAYASIIEHL